MSRRRPPAARASRLAVLAALACAASPRAARTDGPDALGSLVATAAEEALCARGTAGLASPSPEVAALAARELLLSGPAGIRTAARRLRAGDATAAEALALVEVLSASDHREADEVLALAARARAFEVRAVVARALGAGRSGRAVETLVALCADPTSAVRAAALRSLFALDSEAAVEARLTLPAEPDAELLALRLRLHRLRGDRDPRLRRAALSVLVAVTQGGGAAPSELDLAERLAEPLATEAVRVLATQDLRGDPDAVAALWVVAASALSPPFAGRATPALRAAGVDAVLACVACADAPLPSRASGLASIVDLLAEADGPLTGPQGAEARETLERGLGSLGAAIVAPLGSALLQGRFPDPGQGTRHLAALPLDTALDALGRLALFAPHADVRRAAAAELAALRRTGTPPMADRVADALAADADREVRVHAVLALTDEPEAFAGPRLARALLDADDMVASHAADVLVSHRARGDASAFPTLREALLADPPRAYKRTLLDTLARTPDDGVYALFHALLTRGPASRRRDVLDAVRARTSRLRGPEAAALVRRAADEPALGLRPVDVAPALTVVDGPAGVEYIRARWRTVQGRGVFVRNLRQVTHESALDFALALAGELPDHDTTLLAELMTVLSEGPGRGAPARTEAFWRRMLSHRDPAVVDVAVARLAGIPHAPMADLLLPVVADRDRHPRVREHALVACGAHAGSPPTELLWRIASDREEDDDLRREATYQLIGRADPALRRKALAFLSEGVDQASEAVDLMAALAGAGASPGEAADLLEVLRRELAQRFAKVPYFRAGAPSAAVAALEDRIRSLTLALASTGDAASLTALADLVVDPRCARYALEARRHAALLRGTGGGPLAARADPPDLDHVLHLSTPDARTSGLTPVPRIVTDAIGALAEQAPAGASHVLARAIDDARASGDLALTSDAYWLAVMRRLLHRGRDAVSRPHDPALDAAVAAVRGAMARTWPVAGAEEAFAVEAQMRAAVAAGRWAEASAAALDAARRLSRLGLCDLEPSRWYAAGRELPTSFAPFLVLRARADVLAGAAAAAEGKAEEARAAFARARQRAPGRADVLRLCALVKHRIGFDLEGAREDLREAVAAVRRTGGQPSPDDEALAAALAGAAPRRDR